MAYLYRHIRKDLNVPFYIGIGKHIERAYSKSNRNNHWNSIINKTDYKVEILFDEIEYDYAKIKEIEFISLYKRKIDGGTLCNITLGGEGALGIKHTEEAKIKMSIPNRGKIISEEHKKIISKFHTGRKHTQEAKEKMSKNALGEKNHAYGTKASEETKEKMRSSAKKGIDNKFSKLTEIDVLKIRELYKKGLSSREIGKKYNVVKSTILFIVNRKTWKHI